MHACTHSFHHANQHAVIHFIMDHALNYEFTQTLSIHYFGNNSLISHLFLCLFFWRVGGVVSLFVLDLGDFSFISKHYRNLNTNFLKLKTMIFIDNSTVS